MPRTPRSRNEIETAEEESITQAEELKSFVGLNAQYGHLILETLLDIRDAVMEGRSLGDDFFTN